MDTDYNKLLYEKMQAENETFKDWLLSQEPSEILNHAYEKICVTVLKRLQIRVCESRRKSQSGKAGDRSAIYCTGSRNRSKTDGLADVSSHL